jgi:hypothetical protein
MPNFICAEALRAAETLRTQREEERNFFYVSFALDTSSFEKINSSLIYKKLWKNQ